MHGLTIAVREIVTPHRFFEALGVRYAGPIDGHDIAGMEQALAHAAEWDGPIVVHVLTQKGRGYAPAEEDEVQRLHDFKVPTRHRAPDRDVAPITYTDAFTRAMLDAADRRTPRWWPSPRPCPAPPASCPSRPAYPDRFLDVGIAEQHAVTAAAGMAMAGLRPVVAVYSTFFSRAFDQANLDVGLHGLPVVFVLDRAGITGDDGPSHHGVLDLSLALSIPGMTVFAPSSAQEVAVMLDTALTLRRPSVIRFPKTPARQVAPDGAVGSGPAGPPGPPGRRRRCASWPSARWWRRPRRPPPSWPPTGSTPPCGTSGWSLRPTPPCCRRRCPRPGGHRGGRHPGRRGGHVPRRRHARPRRARPTAAARAHARASRVLHPPGQTRPDPGRARPGRSRHRLRGDRGSGRRAGRLHLS